MSEKLENDSNMSMVLFRQGKVIGQLEDLQKSVNGLDTKVDRNYEATIDGIAEVLLKCEERSDSQIKAHAESCPMINKFNLHLVNQEEKDKYKKENDIKQEKAKSNKVGWFKWLVATILALLGLKGLWDMISKLIK